MIFLTRDVNKKTLIFQLTVIACFAFSLYYYFHSRQEEVFILQDLDRLSSQRTKLKRTLGDVAAYNKLLSTDPTLANLAPNLRWEQVDFSWTAVSFTELLRRVDALSRQQNFFVVESFKAGIKNKGSVSKSVLAANKNSDSFPESGERIFRMQGYFLCPSL